MSGFTNKIIILVIIREHSLVVEFYMLLSVRVRSSEHYKHGFDVNLMSDISDNYPNFKELHIYYFLFFLKSI